MKQAFIAIMGMILCVSCTNRTKVPKDILPKEKMGKVMWDLMQVDEYARTYISVDTCRDYKKERTILYQQVFNLHKVSRDVFNKSMEYYLHHPDLMLSIYDTLSARQTRIREEEARIKAINDSVRVRELRRAAKDSLSNKKKIDSAALLRSKLRVK